MFADVNWDGILDVVATDVTDENLQVLYGSAGGLFSSTLVHTSGQTTNLRVGDLDGDRTSDVIFGSVTYAGDVATYELNALYGSTAGPVVSRIGQLPGDVSSDSIEVGLFDVDQVHTGGVADGNSDVLITSYPDSSAVTHVTEVSGDSSRAPAAGFEIDYGDLNKSTAFFSMRFMAGRFTPGATRDELLIPVSGKLKSNNATTFELLVYDMPTANGSLPVLRPVQPHVAALRNSNLLFCSQVAHADLDGDQVEEIVLVNGKVNDGCPMTAAGLLVINTTADNMQTPTTLPTDLVDVERIRLVNVDRDGHPDLVAFFAGDSTTCAPGQAKSCTPARSGILVVWGSAMGLTGETSTIKTPLGPGDTATYPADVAALNLDSDPALELALYTENGLFTFDLQADRSFVQRDKTIRALDAPTALHWLDGADVNRDGVPDVLTGAEPTDELHVYLGKPAN